LEKTIYIIVPLIAGWLLDRIFGDPARLPHPVVGFGKLIYTGDRLLNKGENLFLKGALLAISLVTLTYISTYSLLFLSGKFSIVISAIIVFYSLSGKTLADEVKAVYVATSRSAEEGRLQLARIVGRDTSNLSEQQIRKAALETLAENLSDGVIAPLFWYLILGVPGMAAYKMVNTLDSMIGYKTKRYILFGRFAAKMDDVANYIPARLTALLMIIVAGDSNSLAFVKKYSRCHTSPNSGYPESALAAILKCRFGGPNYYFGELVNKPYIGKNEKIFDNSDLRKAISVNTRVEVMMVLIVAVAHLMINYYV